MTDKKVTPIQVARRWAREHPDATGCIAVQYLVPKGRGGRRGMGTRRDHYLVEAGKAAKLVSRRMRLPEGGQLRSFNGYCYNCGGIFLKPVLHCCYVPNPHAGQPAKDGYRPGLVYADLGNAVLCPACAEREGVVGWHDGRIILSGAGKVTTWLGGGTSECTREPLAVLGLED